MDKDPKAQLIAWLMGNQEVNRGYLARFAEKLARDPGAALDGCEGTIERAAAVRVTENCLVALTKDTVTVEDVRDRALAESMRCAKFPQRSTSPTSNVMYAYQGAAWVEVYEYARAVLEIETERAKAVSK